MKISVITRHAISNYGSLFQTMATQEVLRRLGHEVEIVDYIRSDEHYHNIDSTILAQKPNWNQNPVKKVVYLLLRRPASIYSGKFFEGQRKKYLNLSRRYTSLRELQQDKPVADIYITGSDQVWGTISTGEYDPAYTLSYTDSNDKCLSYAASFGHASFDGPEKDFFLQELKRYRQIAVRERNAVEMLAELGFQAKQVLDPTLMLDNTYWGKYIKHKPNKENYVLIYQLHNDLRLNRYANSVARKTGKKLIRISPSLHQIIRTGKMVFLPELGEFLSYIKYADCLITDSFHGTAFAINMNTPFVEILPTNGTSSRNMSLLNLLGLSDRVLTNDNIELVNQLIDYASVNKKLDELRVESLSVLENMLKDS